MVVCDLVFVGNTHTFFPIHRNTHILSNTPSKPVEMMVAVKQNEPHELTCIANTTISQIHFHIFVCYFFDQKWGGLEETRKEVIKKQCNQASQV